MKDKLKLIPFLFLIFVTLWLRLVNLGYSDYQGDEIRAMWRPAPNQGMLEYLYAQSKGPTQFLVSYLIKWIDPNYANQWLLRLPFSLVGILAILFFYYLVYIHSGKKIAIYAALFLSTNGVFVGLMRIAQYQPYVILFSILTLLAFSLAIQQERWKITGIHLGIFFWAAAVFTHYDGVFIAPYALYLIYIWYRQNADLPRSARLTILAIPAAVSALALAAYYGPLWLSASSGTTSYWMERIIGDEEVTLLPSSIFTFKLYNPLLGLYIYWALGIFSLIRFRRIFPILLWFLFPWVFMEMVIYDPGTHIYTYLIPGTILVAFGVQVVEEILTKIMGAKWSRVANIAWIATMFMALAAISHLIFVDHTPEYPFEQRRILFWTIGGPDETYHQWVFGFPYYRRWEDIREFITSDESNSFYASNEKNSLTSFYIPYTVGLTKAGYYIYIQNPQSFRARDLRAKVRYWREHYAPIKVFEVEGRVVTEIYKMPPGSLKEIKAAGY